MDERECLAKMIAPGQARPTKWRKGVIQIIVTQACNQACFGCTQGSNLAGKKDFMSPEHFRQAVRSLDGYFGVIGVFGGNPATSPYFVDYCSILRELVPFEQRGLWCNDPMKEEHGRAMAATFNPRHSNLNCHLDREAYASFKRWWPQSMPFGVDEDSRHSPPFVAMKDLISDEGKIWELVSGCDINQTWSAAICTFRGELRAFFCEIAGAQAMLHQWDTAEFGGGEGRLRDYSYPDTGLDPTIRYFNVHDQTGAYVGPFKESDPHPPGAKSVAWWQLPMTAFANQVRKHCFDCGVPLRGYGELAQARDEKGADGDQIPHEQCSATHAEVCKPKRKGRAVEVVTSLEQLGLGRLQRMTDYMGNAKR